MEDRRKSVRISCKLSIESSADGKWYILNCKNIGVDGMLLTAESEIEKLSKLGFEMDKKVSLSFYLPNQTDLLKVSGKVVYIERKTDTIEKTDITLIGIQFTDLQEHIKKKLEDFTFGRDTNRRL